MRRDFGTHPRAEIAAIGMVAKCPLTVAEACAARDQLVRDGFTVIQDVMPKVTACCEQAP